MRVDNKSIAEIGEKCLSLGGRWRFGIAGALRDSEMWRPITVTGGQLQIVKGCSGSSKAQRELSRRAATSGREVGIEPVKGASDREPCEP